MEIIERLIDLVENTEPTCIVGVNTTISVLPMNILRMRHCTSSSYLITLPKEKPNESQAV